MTLYEPRSIKRHCSTAEGISKLKVALHQIVRLQQPMTVRQVFYRSTVAALVAKTEAGYRQVQRLLVEMRRDGQLRWSWIVDTSRSVCMLDRFDSPEDAVRRRHGSIARRCGAMPTAGSKCGWRRTRCPG